MRTRTGPLWERGGMRMRRTCLRLPGRVLAVLRAPVLLWTLVVVLMPTGWARARIERRLAKATGRAATVGSLRLGWSGNVHLADLRLAQPDRPTEPWLR